MPVALESIVLELDDTHQLYIVRHEGDGVVYLSLLEGIRSQVQTRIRIALDLEQASRVANAILGLVSTDDWRADADQ